MHADTKNFLLGAVFGAVMFFAFILPIFTTINNRGWQKELCARGYARYIIDEKEQVQFEWVKK